MKLGVSSCGAPLTPDFFARCKSAGIDGIEISVGKKAADELDFALTRRLADEYKIELCSFHLPFSPFNEIDISSPELADQTVKYLSSLKGEGQVCAESAQTAVCAQPKEGVTTAQKP